MPDSKSFTKLSNLVGETITIKRVDGYKFKAWDPTSKKMLISDNYQKGYRKLYQVLTDKGQLDLGSGQIGSLLEAVFKNGEADLINKTFHIKSNGKQGMDIRYFFSEVKEFDGQEDIDLNAPW